MNDHRGRGRHGPRRSLRRLLRLFPSDHRGSYGDEIWEVAAYRWRRAGGGVIASAALVKDLVTGAATLRVERMTRRVAEMTQGVWMDLKFVLRSLAKSGAYVATAITVLACAVASNATVYSYVRGTLLADPGYPEAERVAVVWARNLENGQRRDVISGPNAVDLRERMSAAEAAFFHFDGTSFQVDGRPEVVFTLDVSAEFFDVLGVQPALGRGFGPTERFSGGAASVVVSHAFWRDRLGGSPEAVGETLLLEGAPHEVVGVLGPGFEFIAPAPILRPLADDEVAARARTSPHFNMIARLTDGATLDDLQQELGGLSREFVAEYPELEGWDHHAERLDTVAVEAVRPVILVLVGIVLLVLLVALVNLTMLFRVRTAVREAEIRVRRALGAGRRRVLRILALEPLVLAATGGAIGLMVTPALLRWVGEWVPTMISIPDSAARIPAVRAELTFGVGALTFAVALVGALLLAAPGFRQALDKSSGAQPEGRRVRAGVSGVRFLVGMELAFTTVLCVGAALLVRSFNQMVETDLGVEPEGVLAVRFANVWEQPIEDQVRYFEAVARAVESVPGVERAGVIDYLPFMSEDDFARIYFLDRSFQPTRELREEWRRVDAGTFDAAGMRVIQGRGFVPEDLEGTARTAVVNATFAAKHYADGAAVGEFLSTHDELYRDLRVVGVVADVRTLGPTLSAPPTLYVPLHGNPRGTVGLYVRTSLEEPMPLGPEVRNAIWSVDPTQPVIDLVPLASLIDEWIAIPRAARAMVSLLAALAWGLSVVGVFGVASYAVRSRRSELGIRIALGATPGRLERDHIRSLTPTLLVGIIAGLAAAAALAVAARTILYGVSPLDPLSLLGAGAATGLAALVAVWAPARAVSRIDPAETLAAE